MEGYFHTLHDYKTDAKNRHYNAYIARDTCTFSATKYFKSLIRIHFYLGLKFF
jgi:hypothetical protein